jgi:hypothetical protein
MAAAPSPQPPTTKSFFHPSFRGILVDEEYEDYRAAVHNPAVVHAMCEDYRAGATYDRVLAALSKCCGAPRVQSARGMTC